MPGLEIDCLDFHAEENASQHHTEKYELVKDQHVPVLRRSQTFLLTIKYKDHAFDLDGGDILHLIFEFGSFPNVTKGTRAAIALDPSRNSHDENFSKWDAIIKETSETSTTVEIQIGCGAPVGAWKCKLETDKSKYVHPGDLYIILNPYSEHDLVFMEDEDEREQCVQKDGGKLFRGTHRRVDERSWSFGQFDDIILPACCQILKKGRLNDAEAGNPIKVARVISAMVNSCENNGVLEGKWLPPFRDGTRPHSWSGSVAIIEEYVKSGKPVKYGQCWVFSAVTVTICRALGLPCRSVTNYSSAHDSDGSMTLDQYRDKNGKKESKSEKIWNFHVWNDVWMARPDLPDGYGGWQAIDSTPQEKSGRLHQCGPSPLAAIKEGKVGLSFDSSFVFAEVNADVCDYKKDPITSRYKRTGVNRYRIGKKIVTERNDGECEITSQYKDEEMTLDKRNATFNAIRGVRADLRSSYDDSDEASPEQDVHMQLVDIDKGKLGSPFTVEVNCKNRSGETRTMECSLTAYSVYYTGGTAATIKTSKSEIALQPQESRSLTMEVSPQEYTAHLVENSMIKMDAVVSVKETKQTWNDEDDFALEGPNLSITASTRMRAGRANKIRFNFTNPLDVPLTDCEVSVECPGIIKPLKETLDDVEPGATSSHTLKVTPRKAGSGTMVVVFTSNEVTDVHGSAKISVGSK